MALYVVRQTWNHENGNTADRLVWAWGIEGPDAADDISTIATAIQSSQADTGPGQTSPLVSYIQGGYEVAFYEVFAAQGGPALAVVDAIAPPEGLGPPGATEVQVAVSRLISTPRGNSPRGRLFVGPQAQPTTQRVPAGRQSDHANWANNLHDALVVSGYDPVLIHDEGTPGATASEIVGYRVDDLWDTQRRRGLEVSLSSTTVLV